MKNTLPIAVGNKAAMLATMQRGRVEMRGRCEAIAAKCFDAVHQIDDRAVIHHERKALTGYATIMAPKINGGVRVIKAPMPVTRRSLYIFLHECAHHLLGHVDHPRRKARYVEEMEAEQWAHSTMRSEGLVVPRKETRRAKDYVARKIRQATRRGARAINAKASRYAGV